MQKNFSFETGHAAICDMKATSCFMGSAKPKWWIAFVDKKQKDIMNTDQV